MFILITFKPGTFLFTNAAKINMEINYLLFCYIEITILVTPFSSIDYQLQKNECQQLLNYKTGIRLKVHWIAFLNIFLSFFSNFAFQ